MMIPRTVYAEEHELFRDSFRRFLEAEAIPYHDQWEKDGHVSRGLWTKAGEYGYLCPTAPEAYGGVGADFRYNAVVDEEISAAGLSGIGFGLHSDIAVPYILNYATEQSKQEYIPLCISGEVITAIAMTEPGTGSDLQAIQTTAISVDDGYVINGSKTFITNGLMSDLVIVVAKTDPDAGAAGISLFLVEANTPGFSRGEPLQKIGMKAQDTTELFFQDVRVPKSNLLGAEGQGFAYLMNDLSQERLYVALCAVAASKAVLQHTVSYTKERKVFGKPVASFQNTQFKLAELDTDLTALQVFVDRCLELHLQGKLDAATAAKAKLLSTEVQCKVADECLQLFGGYGYMWEYPVARAWADSRVHKIYAGTNEIMKLIIGRELLK